MPPGLPMDWQTEHVSMPRKLTTWKYGAYRIWGSRGTVLHTWVTRPALKPPKDRIHQKHSKEDVTVTLVGGGKEGTEAKKEKQKVDYVLTPEIRQDTGGLSDSKKHRCIKRPVLVGNLPGKVQSAATKRIQSP